MTHTSFAEELVFKPVINDTGRRFYCGPAIIASITGLPISKVEAEIREYRNRTSRRRRPYEHKAMISGMQNHEVEAVLGALGLQLVRRFVFKEYGRRPTLNELVGDGWFEGRGPHLVQVTGHYVGVHGRTFIDTFTDGKPVSVSEMPGKRKRVSTTYEITPLTP